MLIENIYQTRIIVLLLKYEFVGVIFGNPVNCQILRSFLRMAKPTTFPKEQIWNNELNSISLNKKI